MNWYHRRLCRSDDWRALARDVIVPNTVAVASLGDDVLEVGPGYGATTAALTSRCGRLTALEYDPRLAADLTAAFPDVTVVQGDGAAMPFEAGRFSAVVCFTMLHHLPSAAHQDRLFAEACRVLRPGGVFTGSDSLPTWRLRLIHIADTCVTLDPRTLPDRLRSAGFDDVEVEVPAGVPAVRFLARRA